MASSCARRALDWMLEKFIPCKADQALEQTAQENGGITIAEGI